MTAALSLLALGVVGMFAGTMNAVAGGGSFLAFPALMAVGLSATSANATASLALAPAALASAWAYRHDRPQAYSLLGVLLGISFVGTVLGSWLMLRTPEAWLVRALPFLMLTAATVLTIGPRLAAGKGGYGLLVVVPIQLIISIYGGYFGGGMGIMMLANLSLYGMTQVTTMNSVKTMLATAITGTSIVVFASAEAMAYREGLAMMVGAIVGGYGGARLTTRLPPRRARGLMLIVAWGVTLAFFARTYLL